MDDAHKRETTEEQFRHVGLLDIWNGTPDADRISHRVIDNTQGGKLLGVAIMNKRTFACSIGVPTLSTEREVERTVDLLTFWWKDKIKKIQAAATAQEPMQ